MDAICAVRRVRRCRGRAFRRRDGGAWRSAGCSCAQPDILLLLDEPTNHLDAESILWLEHHLAEYNGTIVAITHDRYFLDNVAQWILEIEYGRCIPWEGNYTSWLEQKQKRLEQDEKQKSARQKTLAKELEWIRTNPKGRQTKNKARIKAYEEMAAKNSRSGWTSWKSRSRPARDWATR